MPVSAFQFRVLQVPKHSLNCSRRPANKCYSFRMNQPPTDVPVTQDRTLETLCHLLGLAGLTGIPFANVLAPLVLWLAKRDAYPSVDAHGKEAVNFQISMSIYTILAGLSMFIMIGFVLLPAVLLTNLVLMILASVRASRGEFYRYPFTIRFIN
jgi:uncharacterized protein